MNHLLTLLVLAQEEVDRFREMGSGLRGERARVDLGELIWLVILALVVLFFVLVLSRVLAKQDRRAKYNSPKALFRSLCDAHELKRHERRLLQEMAIERRLTHPAQVFLEPAWFETAKLSANLKSRSAQVADIARRVFAEPPAEESARETAAVDALIDA